MTLALQPFAARIAAQGLIGLLLFALGFGVGWQLRSDRHADQVESERQAQGKALVRAVDQGALAVAEAQAEVGQLRANEIARSMEIAHAPAPLVVVRRVPAACSVDRPAATAPAAQAAPPESAVTAGPAPAAPGPGAADITLGGLRLWNSALAGRPVAAGACPADDPASPACALGSGRTDRDLWLNHTTNASLCAQDRAQLRELIELLERQKEYHP